MTVVEGAVLLDKPRLMQVDGIYCEAALTGYLIFMKNQDVPGVIGHVGTVLGRNNINIANFSLGRGGEGGKGRGWLGVGFWPRRKKEKGGLGGGGGVE